MSSRVAARPELTLVAVCSGWGTIPLLVRHVDLPAPAIVFARLALAAAALGTAILITARCSRTAAPNAAAAGPSPARPPAAPRGARTTSPLAYPRLLSYRPGRCTAVAAILAAHWLALFAAYERAASGTVILIVYLAPVGVAALAPRTLGERHTRRTLAALAFGATGFTLVAAPAVQDASAAGIALATFAAASFVALILVSKPLAEVYGGLRIAFMEMAGATIVLAPVAALADWGAPEAAWGWLLVLGLVHTAIGTGLYLDALAQVPATSVAILGYLEPAAVVLLGWLFLDETPAPATLASGALIVLAGWLTVTGPRLARSRRFPPVFLGDQLLPYLVLALGGAMLVGNALALIRPPTDAKEGELERAPVTRSVTMMVIGAVAAIWALASLVAG